MSRIKHLTPWNSKQLEIYGGLYDQIGCLQPQSLRHSRFTGYKHRDHAYLSSLEIANSKFVPGKFIYLGHCFGMYGHFLLETLPMLSYLLKNQRRIGLLTPWGGPKQSQKSRQLLDNFLKILRLQPSRVVLNSDSKHIIKADIKNSKRPVEINNPDGLLKTKPYQIVLSRLLEGLPPLNNDSSSKKIFLARPNNRIPKIIYGVAEKLFERHGFMVVRPELISCAQQIALMRSAEILAGYSGSQLHNSIFCKPGTLVINLGDKKSPDFTLANQLICNSISGCKGKQINYSNNPDQLEKQINLVLQ